MSRSEPQNAAAAPQRPDSSPQNAQEEQKVSTVQERDADRESIARELHDKFGQYLTVMNLELAAVGQRGDLPPGLREQLAGMQSLTSAAQQDMVDLVWQIRPASLQGLDLKSACEQLVVEWTGRSDLAFDLHISMGAQKMAIPVQATLYRILQEAVTNVVKHAHATRIGVIIRIAWQEALLIVEDDGCGFIENDAASERQFSSALGLRGIRERLDLVGGTLEIESSPGRGTTLLARVPL